MSAVLLSVWSLSIFSKLCLEATMCCTCCLFAASADSLLPFCVNVHRMCFYWTGGSGGTANSPLFSLPGLA